MQLLMTSFLNGNGIHFFYLFYVEYIDMYTQNNYVSKYALVSETTIKCRQRMNGLLTPHKWPHHNNVKVGKPNYFGG